MVCEIEGCDKVANRLQLCSMHYSRKHRHGNTEHTTRCPVGTSLLDRLKWYGWTVVDSGCWEWNGKPNKDGYGHLKVHQRNVGVHRIAYELWVGKIPRGFIVRHSCDNPPCVNPAHLITGTQADNVTDAVIRGRNKSRRKIPWETVQHIRKEYDLGKSQKDITVETGVDSSTVSRIVRNLLHVKPYDGGTND